MNQEPSAERAVRAVVQRLESLRRAGVTHVPKAAARADSAPSPIVSASPAAKPAIPRPEPMPKKTPSSPRSPAATFRLEALAEVETRVAACTRCAELAASRTQTVFGVGNPSARLVFLGEAPGADEDRQGEPFVGRAGMLLTDIIEKGMKLKRSDVYICNILRCRPPGNRTPLPVEAANCREYLDAQLAIIQPEFICCLGTVAAQNLLGVSTPIGQLRGRFLDYQGIKVICTYHPAYVLRNPAAKRHVWDDIQMLMAEMGLEVPKKSK